jgi:3-hydroxyacyl-[acyl-carrier-protein] dehydratase
LPSIAKPMPPQLIFDISGIDLTKVLFDQEEVRRFNPQRGDMEQLNGIAYAEPDKGRIIGFKDIGEHEFWVSGHIPGRPLYPGVLMIEAGAQLASFFTRRFLGWTTFVGFGGIDGVKFRTEVKPPCRMYILVEKVWERHGRVNCLSQAIVDGKICFEGTITGIKM